MIYVTYVTQCELVKQGPLLLTYINSYFTVSKGLHIQGGDIQVNAGSTTEKGATNTNIITKYIDNITCWYKMGMTVLLCDWYTAVIEITQVL